MTAQISPPRRLALIGILSAVGGSLVFSVNDVTIKFLSGDYALHELVLIRSSIGLMVMLCFILPFQGGLPALRTKRLGAHLLRALCVVASNLFYFLGLAAMPLADAVAVFFIAPLLITALSVPILGEKVGPRRWFAVGLGLAGVIVMLRPGGSTFHWVALLPVASALCYACMHMLTRHMGMTEKAATMAFYVQLSFITVCLIMGLIVGDGHLANQSDPSLAFLFRGWSWPHHGDWPIFLASGTASALGGFFIAQAYRLCEAGLVAPFEYVSMPMAIFWGATVFDTWPDTTAWIGIALICGGGLYMLWREAVVRGEKH
ncbi:MAG: EamA family transporter [Cereibacter sphaeroides]|uniref:EamA family transporter n=1 Tax=Cereibacter sphaeroides TaxID=1063 RepID=A0A2W5S461_CERSP|nr:MAG: EamA family transporter [Cereibacter sphaeroides]